ncbi:MAG: VgrG-related protein [Patulibacter minatonensis]
MTSPEVGVASFALEVNGAAVAPEVRDAVVEIVVDGRLRVPDRLALVLWDEANEILDRGTFSVGASVTVKLAGVASASSTLVFDGRVGSLMPEFTPGIAKLTVSAFDRGVMLQRTPRTASYFDESYGAIARKAAAAAGIGVGTIDDGLTLPYVQQSDETDWDFLWRLAADVDYEVKVIGRELNFRAASSGTAAAPVRLSMGQELRRFAPRVTGMGQTSTTTVRGWDAATQQAVSASGGRTTPQSSPGIKREDVVDALGSGITAIVDRPVMAADHAKQIAAAAAARNANAYVTGEGTTLGNPAITAGGQVQITGVGEAFSGVYAVSGVRHVLRSRQPFETTFSIDGREDRSLAGITAQPRPAARAGDWGHRLAIAVVTSLDDPEQLGRVKVRYPTLTDGQDGWWARVLVPGAGQDRGLVTVPMIGDEVLVGFEGGSTQHPFVLGSLFNGKAKPGALMTTDGSWSWGSMKDFSLDAKGKLGLTTATAMTVDANTATFTTAATDDSAQAALTLDAGTALTLKAGADAELRATQSATVTGGTSLTLHGASSVTMSSDGTLSVEGVSVEIKGSATVKISAPMVMLG